MDGFSRLNCFYSVLGVDKGSSTAEIRTAYRKLAMIWHPDKCSNVEGEAREQAKLKFQVVQEAYSVLSDEAKRLLYDHGLDDDDPTLREFMQDLINKMKEANDAPSERSDDHRVQELNKPYTTAADAGNFARDYNHSDSSTRTSCPEQAQTDPQTSTANFPPKPHPNLFNANGCSQDSFRGCVIGGRKFTFEFEKSSTSGPQPHPNLHTEPEVFDHRWVDGGFPDFMSTQPSVLKEPQIPHVAPAQVFVTPATQNNVAPAFQTCTKDTSATPGGSATSANLSSEAFCMGVGGDGPGRDYRGQGKGSKPRRKKR